MDRETIGGRGGQTDGWMDGWIDEWILHVDRWMNYPDLVQHHLLWSLALADNTLLNFHNSSYHTQPHPIIIISNYYFHGGVLLYLHETYFVFPHQKNEIFNTHESSTPHICYLSSSHNLLIYKKVGMSGGTRFSLEFSG